MQAKRNQIAIGGLLLGLLMFWAASTTTAAEGTPELLPIEPVPMIQVSDWVPTPRPSPARYGFIQQIHPHCFVVADTCRGFSGDAIFRSSVGGPATSRGAFRVGNYVGLRYNKNREVEEIWLAEPPAGVR
ncbi:MAG: hypothetical protein V2I40_11200 [Desulfobacteraceae bacterium]|jgi:hypothetical protein|nr:hypothetical protein [Desulfobacteraceae bacterium]